MLQSPLAMLDLLPLACLDLMPLAELDLTLLAELDLMLLAWLDLMPLADLILLPLVELVLLLLVRVVVATGSGVLAGRVDLVVRVVQVDYFVPRWRCFFYEQHKFSCGPQIPSH